MIQGLCGLLHVPWYLKAEFGACSKPSSNAIQVPQEYGYPSSQYSALIRRPQNTKGKRVLPGYLGIQ